MKNTIRKQLSDLGMKKNELDNWCGDLYVLKNSISSEFIKNYKFKDNVSTFRSKIDGKIWYDIPFEYVEYYV